MGANNAIGDSVAMNLAGGNLTFSGNINETVGALTLSANSVIDMGREALGNDLVVTATGGAVKSTCPLIVEAKAPEVTLEIEGGVGYVPVRFDGLNSVDGYTLYEIVNGEPVALDQAVKGNDFWQTNHESVTNTYRVTYNIPLDGKPSSRWVFKKAE